MESAKLVELEQEEYTKTMPTVPALGDEIGDELSQEVCELK